MHQHLSSIRSGFPGLMGAFNLPPELLLIPGAHHADSHYFFVNASVNSKCVYITAYTPTGISLFEKNLVEISAVLAMEMHHLIGLY